MVNGGEHLEHHNPQISRC